MSFLISCGQFWSPFCVRISVVGGARGMIIGSHLKASVGASAPVHHGGICRPNSVPGSLFGNAIGAGQPMALTSGCSHRSRRPQAPRIRNWKRCFPLIPPACAPTNTRQEHRNRRQIANSQGAGASYKFLPNEPDDHAIGRSRGGLTTKIHALADQACAPVTMLLTPGQSGDNPQLLPLLDVRRSQGRTRFRLLADKAYSHPSTRTALRARRIRHTIPERTDQIQRRKAKGSAGGRPPAFNPGIYKKRNTVERGFNRLKHWRGIATRYDKYATTFFGGVLLSAMITFHRVHKLTDRT